MTGEFTIDALILKFEEFLSTYYKKEIHEAAQLYPEIKSVIVSYNHLKEFSHEIADYLLDHPNNTLYAAEIAMRNLMPADTKRPIHFRIRDLPPDPTAKIARINIRDLRAKHLGKMIAIEGLVRKATEVRPRLIEAVFQCARCGCIIRIPQDDMICKEPLECPKDQGGCGKPSSQTSFKLLVEPSQLLVDDPAKVAEQGVLSTFIDTQKIEIQEIPEGLRGGDQPQRLSAQLEDDLTGRISPGDRVVLNGILRSKQRRDRSQKSNVFDIYLDVNSVEAEEHEFEEVPISEEEEKEIKRLARSKDIYSKITNSIAPSIWGMTTEKEALMLQLFGGVAKRMPDGTRMRGDIHILFVGDPGTAKSQLLRYIAQLSPRGIFTSGKSSSAAGLTAAAVKDDSFGEGRWILEAGALVLADKGIACLHPDCKVIFNKEERKISTLFDEKNAILAKSRTEEVEIAPLDGEVYSFDDKLRRCRVSKSTKIRRKKYKGDMLEIKAEDGLNLVVTPEHLLIDGKDFKWHAASEFKVGDLLLAYSSTENGYILKKIQNIKRIAYEGYVYDLYVPEEHNFVCEGFFVHNCIDELDKMTNQDRSSMHEAMEQQSYHPSTEITFSDGKKVKIGRFVDSLMEKSKVIEGINCEIVHVKDVKGDYFVDSISFEKDGKCKLVKLPVTRVSRHKAPDYFIKLTFAKEKFNKTDEESKEYEILVTPEHPIFVFDKNHEDAYNEYAKDDMKIKTKLNTKPAEYLGVGEEVPILPNTNTNYFEKLDSTKIIGKSKIDNTGKDRVEYVYDITIEPTHNFVSDSLLLHNSISIAKAGITATLQSRCAILGAANPKLGRFDDFNPILSQIDLPPSLLSRFDAIFSVRDKPEVKRDTDLADHILKAHQAGQIMLVREHTQGLGRTKAEEVEALKVVEPELSPDFLRKYIAYAKRNVFPVLTEEAIETIKSYYVTIRRSGEGKEPGTTVPITARQLEAFVRLAEASAKVRLSQEVTAEDASRAIRIVEYYLRKVAQDGNKIDIDIINTGISTSQRERIRAVLEAVETLSEGSEGAKETEIIEYLSRKGIEKEKVRTILSKLKEEGRIYEPKAGSGRFKLV